MWIVRIFFPFFKCLLTKRQSQPISIGSVLEKSKLYDGAPSLDKGNLL